MPVVLRATSSGPSGDCLWQLNSGFGRKVKRRALKAAALVGPTETSYRELVAAGFIRAIGLTPCRAVSRSPGWPIRRRARRLGRRSSRSIHCCIAPPAFRWPCILEVGRSAESGHCRGGLAPGGRPVASGSAMVDRPPCQPAGTEPPDRGGRPGRPRGDPGCVRRRGRSAGGGRRGNRARRRFRRAVAVARSDGLARGGRGDRQPGQSLPGRLGPFVGPPRAAPRPAAPLETPWTSCSIQNDAARLSAAGARARLAGVTGSIRPWRSTCAVLIVDTTESSLDRCEEADSGDNPTLDRAGDRVNSSACCRPACRPASSTSRLRALRAAWLRADLDKAGIPTTV